MPKAQVWPIRGYEQTDLPILSRVKHNGANITQSGTTSVTCKVLRYNRSGGTITTTGTPSVTVSSAVYDALQTGSEWEKDSTGYNFSFTVPASAFPAEDEYTVVFTFTPSSGSAYRIVCRGWMMSLDTAAD